MHDTTCGGLSRPLDNGWARVATERTPAITGLIGSSPNFLAAVEQLGPWRLWIVPFSSGQEIFRAMWRCHARNALHSLTLEELRSGEAVAILIHPDGYEPLAMGGLPRVSRLNLIQGYVEKTASAPGSWRGTTRW